MGYFVSILREKIATYEAPKLEGASASQATGLSELSGVSINDIRKNLRSLNDLMDHDCKSSTARFGIILDASLITGIDPPPEVDSALAAINTAHNHVSSEISLAQASADQKIVQSKRAVEIETLNAQAEVEPLLALAKQLADLKAVGGSGSLIAYLRNVRLGIFGRTKQVILENRQHWEGR
jgi:regulator of protease activity HflC (stomatin/prohibitin superfamily)